MTDTSIGLRQEIENFKGLLTLQAEIIEDFRSAAQYAVDEITEMRPGIKTQRIVDIYSRLKKVLEPQL
jgi:hypothetical protein